MKSFLGAVLLLSAILSIQAWCKPMSTFCVSTLNALQNDSDDLHHRTNRPETRSSTYPGEQSFRPISTRYPYGRDQMVAPGNLTVDNYDDPKVSYYMFRQDQVKAPEIQRVTQSTGKFWCHDKNNQEIYSGSGFSISNDGIVVTAAHVLKDWKNTVDNGYGESFFTIDGVVVPASEAEIIYAGNSNIFEPLAEPDVAILRFKALIGRVKPIAFAEPNGHASPWAYSLGYPGLIEGHLVVSPGMIIEISKHTKSHEFDFYVATNMAFNSGMSGGPVVNERGELLGLATAGQMVGSNMDMKARYSKHTIIENSLTLQTILNTLRIKLN